MYSYRAGSRRRRLDAAETEPMLVHGTKAVTPAAGRDRRRDELAALLRAGAVFLDASTLLVDRHRPVVAGCVSSQNGRSPGCGEAADGGAVAQVLLP